MKPRISVLQFPGVNCEAESERALEAAGLEAERIPWTAPATALAKFDGFLLPGGFSYQDRVRAGAIAARHAFLDVVRERAERGTPVLGLCNGAQVLVEAGLVPGSSALGAALAPNRMPGRSGYLARWVFLRVEDSPCVFTQAYAPGEIVPLPMAHGEGRFLVHPESDWSGFEKARQVPFRYDAGEAASQERGGPRETSAPRTPFPANPNGALGDAAALTNRRGNVLALMPHPERAQSLAQVPLDLPGPWGERRRRARAEGESLWSAGPGAGIFLSLAYALGVRETAGAR